MQKGLRLVEIAAETAKLLADVNPSHAAALDALSTEYNQLLVVRTQCMIGVSLSDVT